MAEAGLVKLVVRLAPDPERRTEHAWAEAETLWAQQVGEDLFEIRNIPWETDALHFLDLVRGRQSADGVWEVFELVRASGHSTMRITFSETAPPEQQDEVVGALEQLVGNVEHIAANVWAIDVNPGADVAAALDLLAKHELDGVLAKSAHT